LLAITVAAMCLAFGLSAGTAQAGKFIGVVDPFGTRCDGVQTGRDCLSGKDLRRMRVAHVRMVRWGFRWAMVQPTPGSYRWRLLDNVIGSLANHGIRVLPVMTGSPPWAAPTYGTAPVNTRLARSSWRRFLEAAVKRYGPHGRYWTDPNLYRSDHPQGPILPIGTWQIWNEQNIRTGAQHVKPSKYVRLVRMSHDAIRDVDPKARILLGGMPGYVSSHAWVYLKKLYRHRGFKREFDAVALHPYAPDVGHVLVQIQEMRRVMARFHDKRSPLWITELGWGSKHPTRATPLNRGPKGQKQLLKVTFPLLRHYHTRWHIRRVFWFRWRDPPPDSPGCTFCTSSGLFRHSQKPKPSWRVFKHISKPRH
jgi:polysaccharide biosynthesis protein PslG